MACCGSIKKAAIAVVRHVKAKRKKTSLVEYIRRLDICEKCKECVDYKCSLCKCPVKRKANWAEQKCDKNKW